MRDKPSYMRMGLISIRLYRTRHQPVRGHKSGHNRPISNQQTTQKLFFSYLSPLYVRLNYKKILRPRSSVNMHTKTGFQMTTRNGVRGRVYQFLMANPN